MSDQDWRIIECTIYASMSSIISEVIAVIHKASEIALISPDVDPLVLAQQINE